MLIKNVIEGKMLVAAVHNFSQKTFEIFSIASAVACVFEMMFPFPVLLEF